MNDDLEKMVAKSIIGICPAERCGEYVKFDFIGTQYTDSKKTDYMLLYNCSRCGCTYTDKTVRDYTKKFFELKQ